MCWLYCKGVLLFKSSVFITTHWASCSHHKCMRCLYVKCSCNVWHLFGIKAVAIPTRMIYKHHMLYQISQHTATPLINTLRPRQEGRHFPDDISKCIFLNENVWILIKISLKFVPQRTIENIPALVQIMAWQQPGDKSLSAPMMVSLLTHICVTRPQLVNNV